VWTDTRPGSAGEYRKIIFAAIQQRRAWREQYDAAKIITAPVDNQPATDRDGDDDGPAP
jgi:hypothetical protein